MTTEPTEKHRDEARELIRIWSADTFDSLRNGETLHLPRGAMSMLSNRVAKVLSARDAEIREVLEGLRTENLSSEYECWCSFRRGFHTNACVAVRTLWLKLQPAKESSDD